MRRRISHCVVGPLTLLLLLAGSARPTMANDCEYPNVLIVLDRSNSMQRAMSGAGGDSIWGVTVDALLQLVEEFQDSIAFGLMLFPEPELNKCTPGLISVTPQPNALAAIEAELLDPDNLPRPGAYTPIKETLQGILDAGLLRDPARRNYILFIADGWQYCEVTPEAPDPTRASALRDVGISTFVVGLENQVDPCLLARMAVLAGTAPATCPYTTAEFACDFRQPALPSQCYYSVTSVESLVPAFETIGRSVSEEICDGIDNNCNGLTDENLVATCTTALCGAGESVCTMGEWGACAPFHKPSHICDCDGRTLPGLTRPCETICETGFEQCKNGLWQNCSARLPETEICGDGIDNDCDGLTDEGCDEWCENGAEEPCGVSDIGRCELGVRTCIDEMWGPCVGSVSPQPESCTGFDDNCNGETDEGLTRPCSTVCETGTEVCWMGEWVDCDARMPVPETCNNRDDDCNGLTDDGLDRPCTTPCGEGVEMCVRGVWLECSAGMPVPETCNGRDDDCNGIIDDGDDLCVAGEVCVDGQCVPGPEPPHENTPWLVDGERGGKKTIEQSTTSCRKAEAPDAATLGLVGLLLLGLLLQRRRRIGATRRS